MQEHLKTSEGAKPPSFVDRMMTLLLVAYPNGQDFGDVQVGDVQSSLYREELEDMAERFGEKRIEGAIRKCIRASEHFPRIAEIREKIDLDNAFSRHDPACRECNGTGWRYQATSPGSPTRVMKCNCDGNAKARVA